MNHAKLRLPAYGRDLVNLQRSGRNVDWLIISLSFDLGKALPRVVVPSDINVSELDLHFVEGLECTVAHKGNTSRAIDVAELALRNGATKCGIHDRLSGKSLTTAEVKAIRGIQ